MSLDAIPMQHLVVSLVDWGFRFGRFHVACGFNHRVAQFGEKTVVAKECCEQQATTKRGQKRKDLITRSEISRSISGSGWSSTMNNKSKRDNNESGMLIFREGVRERSYCPYAGLAAAITEQRALSDI